MEYWNAAVTDSRKKSDSKHQTAEFWFRVSGFRCQEEEKQGVKPDT